MLNGSGTRRRRMAKRWSVAGLLLATGLMSGHALAVVLDLDKPFKPQAEQVRTDLADGEKYSEISQDERAKVGAALDRIEAAFQTQPDIQALQPEQLAAVRSDQEFVTRILTRAREDSRLICRRERAIGSQMSTKQCMTAAQRRCQTTVSQDDISRRQR
ncbi:MULTISPECIES: hypothetical protein [Xanthomonas]|uniref:hypothetical protein n=1 Tax=Xanthomonas TaxID=338 RepID=UPI0006E51BD4|nr:MULTISPECIES: hypothetical protein [Xanthomonas]MBO9747618.1 hypothetical protein [Xanthomonas phaseoli pv. dieffenbachiae]MBO9753236.1 hypothetical protein [Xanthomonas phaseoli pv. dieffenbachiae]MBO9877711.1 hypothetical protein [Xanthomonas sp. D-99]MBO9890675.1 hypothetical protein [Xanthomonas sp. D-36-1]OQP73135.1 hypothetical protein IB69_016495 [Xanthomonas citri]